MSSETAQPENKPIVYIISGGPGVSGEQLVQTALAQFSEVDVVVEVISQVRDEQRLEEVMLQVATTGGLIVHTLVDVALRQRLIRLARERHVTAIDAMGRLLSQLANVLGREPRGQPGLYRQLRQAYFDRIDAIDFTLAHDDGRNPQGWSAAEIVLLGASRVGKTPLSMLLAVQGWRVANIPLVPKVPVSETLFELDRRRVVGLTIEPRQLLAHRQQRQKRLGVSGGGGSYTDLVQLYEEDEAARRLYRRGGFAVIDATDKPIEESAGEVIALMNRRLR